MHSGIDIRRRCPLIATVVASAVLAGGCPRARDAAAPETSPMERVQSFSERAPVRILAAAPPYVFSASEAGLDRWDPSSGESLRLDADHGLPGHRVEALAHDGSRGWLWVATSRGMTRYVVKQGTFVDLKPPPSVLGLEWFADTSLAPAGDGGVWIGHERGLFYTNPAGQWTGTGITEPVRAVLRTRSGWLWIAAKSGLIGRSPDGETLRFDRSRGCDLARVRFMAEAPGGTPLVVGDNQDGEQRITLLINKTCKSYRASPDERWQAAVRSPDELVVLAGERLYGVRMSMPGARSLSREGMRLLPVAVTPDNPPSRSPYLIRSLDVALPGQPLALGATGTDILIGTRSLGIARISSAEPGALDWLRHSELVDGAEHLSVACVSRSDCFVATGGRHAWRYRGTHFTPVAVDEGRILAVVRSVDGDIYALARRSGEPTITAHRRVDGQWRVISGLDVEVPEGTPHIRCARFAPGGLLWLGLAYQSDAGELRSYGAAMVDVDLGVVAYHRASARDQDVRQGVLPIPIGVGDLAFLDDEVWLATSEGAAQVRGQKIRVFSEAEGLRSELLRGVAVSPGGIVFAASGKGVQVYDGESWSFPEPLRWPVNDVEMGADGRLWMATDRGVAVFDGARVRRIDERRGLLQNRIDEIRSDRFGRIWARGSQGLAVIAPSE